MASSDAARGSTPGAVMAARRTEAACRPRRSTPRRWWPAPGHATPLSVGEELPQGEIHCEVGGGGAIKRGVGWMGR